MAARRRSGGSSGRGARARKPPTVLYSPELAPPRVARGGAGRGRSAPSAPANEFAAALATVRSQVAKYRTAAALLDAYELDGWRGASREKLRPEAELAAARRRILEAKLRIRDCLRVLDEAGGHVSIPEAAFDADGEVDETDVFCAACREHESTDDNDIVLCDGDCRRAYHLGCLNPPITLEDLPPGDEGWLCPACDAKLDAVWMVNSAFGTEHASDVPWSDVFAVEAARAASAPAATALGGLGGGDEAEWPSDEEDDEDFDPSAAAARLASPRGAGSDGGGESGSDGDDEEGEEDEEDSESDEDADAAAAPRRRTRALAAAGGSDSDVDADAVLAADAAADASDTSSESEPAPILGKRRRAVVDYAALNEEMFGGGGGSDGGGSMSLLSDDDDWRSGGPASPRSAGGGSGFASPRSGAGASGFASPRSAGGGGITGRGRNGFGPAVASALEAAFARDALPKAAAKEALAARTGLTAAQVNTWFNNRRQRVKREGAAAAAAAATPASRRRSDAAGDAPPEAAAPAAAGSGGARGAAAQPPAAKKAKPAAAAGGPSPGVASPPGGRFPPAVAARLEALYTVSNGAPSEKQRVALVAATGLTRLQVRTWFMNQRSRRNTPGRR